MRFIGIVSLIAAVVVEQAQTEAPPAADSNVNDVVTLNGESYDAFLAKHDVSLVEFFAPWCGHCKKLEPEYKRAATQLKPDGIPLAQVDCVANEELCKKLGINGYPTMKIFNKGEGTKYEGPRDAEGIVKYVKKQIGEAVTPLLPHQLANVNKDDDVALVGVFSEGSEEAKKFKEIAEELRMEHTFVSLKPGIYMVKKFDEGFAEYKGKQDVEDIKEWISTESLPAMGEVTPQNFKKYMKAEKPLLYLFTDKEETHKEANGVVEQAIKKYRGKLNAVYLDGELYKQHAKALMLPEKWPGIVIHDLKSDLKYPYGGKITVEELTTTYLDKYFDGTLEPSYRSEEIPTKDEGPVKTVVFKSFESVVMDEKKDVFLELFAPWCGACKRLAPIYDSLAKTYAPHSDKIVIAKMDATANDLPQRVGIKITKLPTLVLFKAGKAKEYVEYEGERENVEMFVEFISKNAVNKVTPKIISEVESKEKEEL